MTYNISDLPWPIRSRRSARIETIAARLASLRHDGRQPHIVVLQEAFSDEAKRIGAKAGYRYVASGPARETQGAEARTEPDRIFARQAGYWTGERAGRLFDSGLVIFSDFPIVSVRSLPFPAFACAGFDCLANKGIVMALVEVPGANDPVAIVDVHLNARRKSGVALDRADYAFRRQLETISLFVKANVPPDVPLILAGDFNIGTSAVRRHDADRQSRLWGLGRSMQQALGECARIASAVARRPAAGPAWSLKCDNDRQYALSGHRTKFDMSGIAVPFGHDQYGDRLSDHVGYIVYYRRASPSPNLDT